MKDKVLLHLSGSCALCFILDCSIPVARSIKTQGCQLSQIIQETPDFELYLPVFRLMSGISRIIVEVCYF